MTSNWSVSTVRDNASCLGCKVNMFISPMLFMSAEKAYGVYCRNHSVVPTANHLNSGPPRGQCRVSTSIVQLIMEQEPSWLPTQYIMLVISRPTHTHTCQHKSCSTGHRSLLGIMLTNCEKGRIITSSSAAFHQRTMAEVYLAMHKWVTTTCRKLSKS